MSSFRLDRTVTINLAQPVLRVLGCSNTSRIPMLMYHGINDVTGVAHPYFETNTSPTVFALQMRHLREHGYRTIDLKAAVQMINSGANLQGAVVITFDDGFRDFYTHAIPILQEHQFTATMFVVSSFIESASTRLVAKNFMTWSEVREIESLGIEIGSHTVSHPHLHSLHLRDVDRELKGSKQTIEDKLGRPVNSFSYPYAFPEHESIFLEQLRQCLESTGYEYGVTTVLGGANQTNDRYFLPRIPINEHDDIRLFEAKLKGEYDWLHLPQSLYKFMRSRYINRTCYKQSKTANLI
jgi:peptidoglycan/xylan/chitin deacetylase (PgdA/CDA1 family)